MKHFIFISSLFIFILSTGCGGNNKEAHYVAQDMVLDTTAVAAKDLDISAKKVSEYSVKEAETPVKLVKTAGINCKVKDVHQSTRAISQLAKSLGGMICHQDITSNQNQSNQLRISDDSIMVITAYSPQAEITVRVPSQNLETFIYGISNISYFIFNNKMDIDDRSLDYLANKLRQQSRIQTVNNTLDRKTKTPTMSELTEIKDEAVDQQITNLRTDADVRYSIVQLSLVQNSFIQKEIVANCNVSDYNLPLGKRFCDAFLTGWDYFLCFFVALTHFWPFIFLTLIAWIGYRYVRARIRKSE